MVAYFWLVGIVSVAAVIALASPTLIVLLLFSFVGIPLAFLLCIAPALATVLVPAVIFQYVVFPQVRHLRATFDTGTGIGLSLAIVVALNVAVAVPLRLGGIAKLDALVAADMGPGSAPAVAGTVGVVADGNPFGTGLFECPELCQRLLLTGTADRVVLTHANSVPQVPKADRYAVAWHMERRGVCPGVALSADAWLSAVPGEPERGIGVPTPGDVMKRAVESGNCLIRTEGTYGRPDFTILDVYVRTGPAAGRQVALIRHDQGGDVTLARVTAARAAAIGPILVALPILSTSGPSEFGFWRPEATRNVIGTYETGPDLARFLTGMLGLDLAVVGLEGERGQGG